MIRCYPVDGSEAFEVDAAEVAEYDCPAWGNCRNRVAALATSSGRTALVRGRECRIESWKDRAQRLERENILLRLARDYLAARADYDQALECSAVGAKNEEAACDAIEAQIVALGHTLAEVQNL